MKKFLVFGLSLILSVAGLVTTPMAANAAGVAPDAPVQLSGLPGDGYIAARVFIATTGAPATSVTVTASPGGANCDVIMPAITCNITGLTNGTSYTLSAVSNNADGSSSATAAGWSVAPSSGPHFTAVANDCPGATWVLQPCYPASIDSIITLYGVNLQNCTQVTAFGGGYYTAIPTTVNADGTQLSFVHPGNPSAFGWMSLNCGITQNAFMINALYPIGTYSSVTPSWSSSSGPLAGGQTVTLTTSYYTFSGVTAVTLGGKAVSYTVIDATHLQFVVPAGDALGSVDLSLTNAGGPGTLTGAYTYLPNPPSAPGKPGVPSATSGVNQATVTVSAPTDGGTPTSYTVTASPGGLQCTVVVPATDCTITGLTAGTSYTFTATASNDQGSSVDSDPSAAVVPTAPAPGKPGVPSATSGVNQATVTVSAPTDGGTPTSYTVTASPGGLQCTVVVPATDCTITGLTAGSSYTFTATASNDQGSSVDSDPSAAVVPTAPAPQYSLSYDPNGAASGQAPTDGGSYTSGSNAVVADGGTLAKPGYSFMGWNTAADGSGTSYYTEGSITLTANVTLYAQWQKDAPLVAARQAHIHRFKGNSARLRPGMRTQIGKFLKSIPHGANIVCEGHTGGSRVTGWLTKLALARAKSVCDYAVHVRPDLTITLVAKPASPKGAKARNTWMYFNPVS